MDMISTRDRLMLAFAELDAYGIVATHAAHGSPELTRIAMRSLLLSRYPNGTGAFVFRAAADEDNFDADGMLRADLPLYPSGPAEDEAVRGAFAHQGLEVIRRPDDILAVLGMRQSLAEPPRHRLSGS